MSAFPSLPLFTDAYIADTAHLTNEEHGAYLRLLMFAWRSPECRLPNDDGRLARMLGLSIGKWTKLKVAVMAFWSLDGGFWTQKRLAKEHEFVTKKVEQKRANGKQGGRPKSLSDKEMAKANGSEIKTETKAPTPTPINTPVVPKGTGIDRFEEFRAAYPKRKTVFPTTQARKRWDEAIKRGAHADDIIAGAKAYAAEQSRIGNLETVYVQTADVWLNKQRWKDYASQTDLVSRSMSASQFPDETWRRFVAIWRDEGHRWLLSKHSPEPDDPRTKVPAHILAEMNIHPARARAA